MALRALAALSALPALSGCAGPDATVAVGLAHSCALRNGRIGCWGADGFGQLGLDGQRADRIAAGGDTTCALLDGRVRCVGLNHRGQLGDGTLEARSEPVYAMAGAVDVSVGFAHVCALDRQGQVWCWGWNGAGQSGRSPDDVAAPERVEGLPPFERVVAGYDTSCGVTEAGRMHCWGRLALDEAEVNDVAIGADHVCALRDDSLTCWGAEPGGARPPLAAPRRYRVRGGRHAAGGIDHLCFTDADDRAHCLGKNEFGQLGRGDFQTPEEPSPVLDLGAPVDSLAVGGDHSCAVVEGETWCWGWNELGQLGQDDDLDSAVPVRVP